MTTEKTHESLSRSFTNFQDAAHQTAIRSGFWDNGVNPSIKAEKIALIHSEVSEILEAVRKPGMSKKIPDFTQEEEELADTLIRLMDYAAAGNLDMINAAIAKNLYNKTRPHKHGKAL